MDWHSIGTDIRTHFWIYLSLPFVSAVIGYVTKLVAIRMMFQPVEFVGIRLPLLPPLGWQGIIPRNAARMAGIAVETMTQRLIRVDEVFARIDAQRVAELLQPPLTATLERTVTDVAEHIRPGLWKRLPETARQHLVSRVQADLPRVMAQLMTEARDNLDGLFDLRQMVVGALLRDKPLLNRIFQQTGGQELRFFGTSGFYFGFAIGLVQMITWVFWKEPWLLPAFGLFVGFASDWLALQMLFRPLRPRRILGLRVQGLFLRRQRQVAEDYASLIASELLTPAQLWEALLKGPMSARVLEMLQRHVRQTVDEHAGLARPLLALVIGSAQYLEMKKAVADRLIRELPDALPALNTYLVEAMDIRNTLVTRMQALSAEDFEGMLRPVFRQDEWLLIGIGAALGFLVGELQVLLMVH